MRTGPVIGVLPVPFQHLSVEMRPGDLLVAFSDGYSEVADKHEELFGEDRIRISYSACATAPWPKFTRASVPTWIVFGVKHRYPMI